MDAASDSMRGWRVLPAPSIIGAFIFFTCLWRFDYPKPSYDDLFYSGAALHLAGGGDFSNPLIARQGFPSHFFFVYPPIQSYMLAGWLKVFGIGASQILAFTELAYFTISAATIFLLRRRNSPTWMEWAAPLGVAFVFLPLGLRPEGLGTALTLAGFVIASRKHKSLPLLFAGFFLMFFGGACAPRVLYFAGALVMTATWLVWGSETGGRLSSGKLFAVLTGALLLTVLLFLGMIHFRITEFWTTFNMHASRVAGKPLAMLVDYVKHTLGILQWPLVLLPLGLLLWAIGRSKGETRVTALYLAAAFVLTAFTGSLGVGTLWWFIFLMLLLAGPFIESYPGKWALGLQLAVALSLLVYGRKLVVECYGVLSGNISLTEAQNQQTAVNMRPTPEHPLLLDGAAARYVFDYRLPEGVLDLDFGTVFPGTLPGVLSKSELRKGDIYMAGPATAKLLADATYLDLTLPTWHCLALSSFGYLKYPRQLYILPAEKCVDHRPMSHDAPWLPKTYSRP
jgi:hypothetical protein